MLKRLAVVLATLVVGEASAQSLPAPSRTVYKCEVGGKVAYSDSPCLGGSRVDVEPTRGLNKSSGTERIGADVRSERSNEAMAEALHPVFGEDAEQRALRHRRAKLPASSQSQCARLDGELAKGEAEEKALPVGEARAPVQRDLYRMRVQFAQLKC